MSNEPLTRAERVPGRVDDRRRLAVPLAALLATQAFHIAATVANDGEPTAHHAGVGPPLHIAAVLATVGLLTWIRRRGPYGDVLTACAGAAVALAAVVYHLLPFETDVTNPFWDGATRLQQVSVFAGIVAGAWCVVRGLHTGPRPASARRSARGSSRSAPVRRSSGDT